MKIGVDARFLGHRKRGTAVYSANLIRALSQVDRENQYVLIRSGRRQNGPFVQAPNFFEHYCDDARICDPAWEQCALPSILCSEHVDTYYAPTSISPLVKEWQTVITIHDLGFERHPDFYDRWLLEYLKKWLKLSCEVADRIIAVSEFTKDDIVETYGIPAGRIAVVYSGVSEEFIPFQNPEAIEQVKRRYAIWGDYVLCFASIAKNKNFRGALEAFGLLKKELGQAPLQLVAMGNERGEPKEIMQRICELDLQDDVVLTGYVSDHELPLLYAGAKAFLFPSLYEGFGLPVLEAMASGTPVVASDVTSLPEACGKAARLAAPNDHEALAGALHEILTNETQAKKLAAAGIKRARRFSWRTTAHQLVEVMMEDGAPQLKD